MALSVQDILRLIEQLPYQFAKQFVDMLATVSKNLADKAQERLQQQQAPKEFRRPPFIKDDLAVGRDKKIVPGFEEEDPRAKPKYM